LCESFVHGGGAAYGCSAATYTWTGEARACGDVFAAAGIFVTGGSMTSAPSARGSAAACFRGNYFRGQPEARRFLLDLRKE